MKIKRFLFSFTLLTTISFLNAQTLNTYHQGNWPELARDTGWYKVKGYRHGTSYFTQHRFPEVEYTAGDRLSFDSYHSMDVMYTWLERWAKQYPGLLDLYLVDHSYEGRPIYQVSLTNKETGKDTDKPAAYFEGGRHSGEVTASESAFWLIRYLLEQYGKDPSITRLLDEKAIYVRVQNNPDGSCMYLHTAQRNRSTVRPHDNDGDGLLDEDPEEDLDGDGIIYQIRYKDDREGNFVVDPADPTGRLMKRVPVGTGTYRIITEGVDNDGDGKYNEDGIGGLDLHRNYPENWRPDEGMDLTGRGYTQSGAGEYPLSEVETRSVFTWLMSHPNISVVNSMDTRVPMHLRGPSVAFEQEVMTPSDASYFHRFDSLGMTITGYPWAGDVYDTYHTRYPVSPWSGDSTRPSPLFGHGPDFGYSYFGAVWYGDELWNGGAMKDYNQDGELNEADALIWDDLENGGAGFREWEPFHHPQLGEVEMGGFHPKFFSQNGPPALLESWAGKQALFNIEMAKSLPRLKIATVDILELDRSRDSSTYRLDITYTNTGKLPTALDQAILVKMVKPDRVELDAGKEGDGENPRKFRILVPAGSNKTIENGFTGPGETRKLSFVLRKYGRDPLPITVRLLSTRGGTDSEQIVLD